MKIFSTLFVLLITVSLAGCASVAHKSQTDKCIERCKEAGVTGKCEYICGKED